MLMTKLLLIFMMLAILIPVFGVEHFFDQCLNFNSGANYVQLPNESSFDLGTNMTVELWIHPVVWSLSWQAIVTKGDDAWRLHRNQNSGDIIFTAGGVSVVSSGVNFINKWTHVAAVKSGSMLYLYINGNLNAIAAGAGTTSNQNDPVWIGNNADHPDRAFHGMMDEVRIWNYARTQAQIKSNRYNHISPTSSGLVAYYKMDSLSGIIVYDATGNHNGMMFNFTGSTWVTSWVAVESYAGEYAYHFSGDDDDITFAPWWSSVPTELTAEIWFYPDSLSSEERTILYHGEKGEFEISIQNDEIKAKYKLSNSQWTTYNYSGIFARQWYHAALVINTTGETTFYLNGSVIDSEVLNGAYTLYNPGPTYCGSVGSRQGTSQFFRGKVDELRIWNYARTALQIWDNRHHTVSNTETGLIAYYQFNETGIYDRQVVYNRVSTNAAGTVQGSIGSTPSRVISDWPENENYYGGIVSENTVWPTGTLPVWGNITILEGAKLTLNPGTTLEFLNHYGILAYGSLQALGAPADSIYFGIVDTTGFHTDIGQSITHQGSWNGITIETSAASDSTLMEHCVLKYAKAADYHIGSTDEKLIGGGLFVKETGRWRISNSDISNCIAGKYGGGAAFLDVEGGILEYSRISNNRVSSDSLVDDDGSGGGVHLKDSIFTIRNCAIFGNEVNNNGGGVLTNGGMDVNPLFYKCSIFNNFAGGKGGGICLNTFANSTIFQSSYIRNNQAQYGGGIALNNQSMHQFPRILSCVISQNLADYGGAMYINEVLIGTYKNNTVVDNHAEIEGGALYLSGGSATRWYNSIFWGNTSAAGNQVFLDDLGCNPRFDYCDIQGGFEDFEGDGSGAGYSETYINNCLDIDPEFTDNSDLPYSLHPWSPLINRGLTGSVEGDIDIAGNPRVYQTGINTSAEVDAIMNSVDLGAYENQTDSGVMPYDFFLQNGNFNHNLTIPKGVSVSVESGSKQFAPGKGIQIYGSMYNESLTPPMAPYNFCTLTALNTELGWNGLAFLGTPGPADSSYVSYTIISHANTSEDPYPDGGGVFVQEYGNLVMSNCRILNCSAEKGGGISVEGANPRFYSSLIKDCSSTSDGGGIYFEDASPYLIHLSVLDNTSLTGISSVSAVSSSNAKLMGSLIWDNTPPDVSGSMNVQYSNIEGSALGGSNINQDPQLSTNPDIRYQISSTSPCLNKGIVDTTNYPGFPTTDIAGHPRKFEHDVSLYSRLDIGAYEYQGVMDIWDFTASDGNNDYHGYVYLTWSYSPTYTPFTGFNIYRDDVLLTTLLSRTSSFSDHSAIPGTKHIYSIETFCGLDVSQRQEDIGFIKPNGIITGTVTTPNNNPVSGVRVTIDPSLGKSISMDSAALIMPLSESTSFSQDFTLEAWIKTVTTNTTLFSVLDSLFVNAISVDIDENGHLAYSDGVNIFVQEETSQNLSDDSWHHLAISYDASALLFKMYIDGSCVTDTSAVLQDYNIYPTFLVSGDFDNNTYVGLIDDLRLWNIARSQEQIDVSRNVIIPHDSEGLTGYWPMNEGFGDEVFDATNYANHAMLFGVTWTDDEPGVVLGGITNNWGEYVISQIPYGNYTTFTVTPVMQGHFFQPQQRLITLSASSISANEVDFTDNSLIPISGRITYVNTDIPVVGVQVLLNGYNTTPPTTTDEDGHYVMDVEQGSSCLLSARFHDQFFDREWDLGTVEFPQANKNFQNTTLVNLQLEVLGGDDRYPIGAFDVTLRSTNDLYNQVIDADELMWEPGIVLISSIPPLDYNVSVTPNPSVTPYDPFFLGDNPQFMNNNSKNIDLLYPEVFSDSTYVVSDTLCFIWHNPLEIDVSWPDDYELKYLVEDTEEEFGFYVVEQNEWIDLTITAFEDYSHGIYENRKTPVRYCSVTITDEIGPLGETEGEFEANTAVNYSFAPYLPNLSPDTDRRYQNMLEVTVHDPSGQRYATSTDWALIMGARPTENTFSTVSPQIPFLILHDPPGDQSYASFEQTASHSTSFQVSVQKVDNDNEYTHIHLGPDVVFDVGFMFSTQTEIDITLDMNYGLSSSMTQTSDTLQVYTFTTSEEYRTSDQESLIGRESDLYIGGAMNLLWGITHLLSYDEDTRTASVTNDVMVTPDGFATTYIYTESQINLTVIPNALAIGDTISAAMWQSFIDMNTQNINNAVENENHPGNISFNAGAGYYYEETTISDTTFTITSETVSSSEFGTDIGLTVNGVGGEFGFMWETQYTWGYVSTNQTTTETTVSYMLADDDETSHLNYQSDYFTVDIKKDPVYGTPVFYTAGGASSNRWEQNTQPRDGVNLWANTYTASGLLENELAVFQLNLQNTSQSNEDRRYFLTLHHESNPHGAIVLINGLPLVERMPFDLLAGQTVQAMMTVQKGPYEYDYEDITLEFYAEGDRGNEGPAGHYFYVNKSFDIIWETPYSKVNIAYPNDNWIINSANNDTLLVRLNQYNVQKPNFEALRLQYKRPWNPDWITALEISADDLQNTIYCIVPWDVSSLGDGAFELRAGAIDEVHDDYYCTPITGLIDRSCPELISVPQPADGILIHGESINISFSEYINPNSILPSDAVSLEIVRTSTMVDIRVDRFENMVYIVPNIANYWIENEVLRACVSGIEDLNGNTMQGEISWEFFVNANPVHWEQPKIELIKPLGETMTITTQLVNSGGQLSSFSIEEIPQWLTVDNESGTLLPLDYQSLVFTISNQLGYGTFRDTLHADIPALGREPLVFEISVLANPPAWASSQLNIYEYSMTITGQLYLENEMSTDANDIIGAFVLDDNDYVCRGVASLQSVPYSEEIYQFFLTVHSDQEEGEELLFRVWDSSAYKEHLGIQEAFFFSSGAVHGTPLDPMIVNVNPELISSISCRSGWNWLSVNLLNSASMNLDDLLACLDNTENDLVKNHDAYAQYLPGVGWVGTLEDIGTTEMVKLHLELADELVITGTLEETATTSIDYGSGWNWIGYLPHVSISLNEAMADLASPTSGDLIKNQTGYSQYVAGYGWFGSLIFMEPGAGYMLNSSTAGSFNYPDYVIPRDPHLPELNTVALDRMRDVTGWTVNPLDYELSSNITAVAVSGEEVLNSEDLLLGAFHGDECRGVAMPLQVLDQWLFFLTQYSNLPNQTLNYKVYLADSDLILDAVEVLPFVNNQILGDPLNPFQFHLSGFVPDPPQNLDLQVIGEQLELSWDEVAGATSYSVYSSDTPEGEFVEITSQGSFSREAAPGILDADTRRIGTRQRIIWTSDIPVQTQKFYHVTAHN
jgi:hypothetical protein